MRNNEEHLHQVAIVQYLRMMRYLVFAVPNANYRNPITGYKLKAEGMLPGTADLVIVADGEITFVEVKTAKGKQSDTQRDFEVEVTSRGFDYLIWRSLDDAMAWHERGK